MANQSSPKEPGKSSFLRLDDIDPKEKASWVQAAQRAGGTLHKWVTSRLNLAAERERGNQSTQKQK